MTTGFQGDRKEHMVTINLPNIYTFTNYIKMKPTIWKSKKCNYTIKPKINNPIGLDLSVKG